jgi:CTP synthase
MKTRKFIFIVGGVLSGVGKGITAASIGAILKSKGLSVTALKADPYINVDAGTMNPTEHGEVFVLDDGDETDQDMGNYERFLDISLTSDNYMTTGRVYLKVIQDERSMKYKGKCVEVVPHIPLEILRRIHNASEHHDADVTIVEIGGTIGEYQNVLFLEAARRLKLERPKDVVFVLVSYLPIPSHLGEMKTKPTQHAARSLNSTGINADFIIARGEKSLDKKRAEKLGVLCGVKDSNVISAPDAKSIYEVLLNMEVQNFGNKLLKELELEIKPSKLAFWKSFNKKVTHPQKEIKIAVIGKYFGTGDYTLADSYISVIEAVKHAAWSHSVKPVLEWIDSEEFETKNAKPDVLKRFDGVIVPGGFGTRGVEGIIKAIEYARVNQIPYLGLCYGMQLACVEFARNILNLKDANTVEMKPNCHDPIIHINPNQAKNVKENRYGGTMRLGAYSADLKKGSKVAGLYKALKISERHRHRYEFNNEYRNALIENGMEIVGINKETDLVEIIELKNHPFFVGTQFHPEFKSRPMRPHPLFVGLIKAAMQR